MAKKIVVCGGNGFLGSRICKHAVSRGHSVISLSRSGEPQWAAVSSSSTAPSWSKSVQWQKSNILSPATYRSYLTDADAVVHSMGILLEADYKGVVSGRENPISGLQRAFSGTKMGASENPLERRRGTEEEGEIKSGEHDGQLTYELMNRDSAITLAREASAEKAKSFVYISAAAGAPMLPRRYITTKREAESTIASQFPNMRSIFIRPGFLYDNSRTFTLPIAAAGGVGSTVNSFLGGRLTPWFGAAVEKPQKADLVAEAVVEAIEDGDVKGVVDVAKIDTLAEKGWRREML